MQHPMVFVVLGIIALTMFGLSLIAQAAAEHRCERARHWASVPGQIATSTVRQNGNGTWMPEVSYTYVIDGQAYASDRLRPGGTPFFYSQAKAAALAATYPQGSSVTVRYDTRRPRHPAIDLTPMSYWILPLRVIAASMVAVAILLATLPK